LASIRSSWHNVLEHPVLDSTSHHPTSLIAWARLVRIPAVFTVIAQVAAAFLLASGTPQPVGRFFVVILAAVFLYWSGMIFNDLWDIDEDRLERPTRPLPGGEVSMRAASIAAWGLLVAGVGLAALSGFIPSTAIGNTACPAVVGVSLAICILLYNGPLKSTLVAPFTMGLCRAICFGLGAAPLIVVNAGNFGQPLEWFSPHLLAAGIGIGIYIMGITTISRSETVGGKSAPIAIGTAMIVLGAICMGVAPRLAPAGTIWKVALENPFILLIGLVTSTIVFRGIRAAIDPQAAAIQQLVRAGVLTLIPLAAAFAVLAAGPTWGLAVFSLVVPALFTAARVRVT
jgi:4-hydroxybenzoate polyprenyltransferase